MKLLVCAGGTGGGIYPALAAISGLEQRGLDRATDVIWIGTKGEMEETLVPREGIRLETIQGGAMVSVPLTSQVKHAAQLAASVPKAWRIIGQFQPDVMLMTGGYMAPPVALAARSRGVPIAIYLPDVEPGAGVRSVLSLASKIATTTDGSAEFVPVEKMVVTGYPVRPVLTDALNLTKAEALALFELTPERPTVFVFGGSRGAQAINRALMGALPELLEQVQIIHVSGTETWHEVEANLATLTDEQKRWYRPRAYLHDDMGAAFRAADLAVARAGASMLGEGPAFGLPAILVPLAWAWRYQKVNADYLESHGAALQLTDETLPEQIAPTILGLINDPERLGNMARAAEAVYTADATGNLADLLMSMSGEAEA